MSAPAPAPDFTSETAPPLSAITEATVSVLAELLMTKSSPPPEAVVTVPPVSVLAKAALVLSRPPVPMLTVSVPRVTVCVAVGAIRSELTATETPAPNAVSEVAVATMLALAEEAIEAVVSSRVV